MCRDIQPTQINPRRDLHEAHARYIHTVILQFAGRLRALFGSTRATEPIIVTFRLHHAVTFELARHLTRLLSRNVNSGYHRYRYQIEDRWNHHLWLNRRSQCSILDRHKEQYRAI